jgi:type 1 fimbriae regulatory protein FimB
MESLTFDELLTVLRVAREQSTRNWCMILSAFAHGLRASEVCKLKVSDLNDGHLAIARLKGSLRTIHSLQPHRGQPRLDEVKAIKQWLSERPTDAGDALCPSQKGGCMSATQFYRIFRAAAIEAGLPTSKQHPHVLKHTCCTTLVRSDMNIAKVKAYVGHKAIASTMRYVTVSDSEACTEASQRFMRMAAS